MFVTRIKGVLAALVGVGLCGAVGVALLAAQDDKPTPKDRVPPVARAEKRGNEAPPLSSKELVGAWEGEKDGVRVEVKFTGADDVWWAVTYDIETPTRSCRIRSAGDMKREDGKPGTVHLRFNSLAKPTGTVIARLERGDGGTLKLDILPAAGEFTILVGGKVPTASYKPVEGLVLRRGGLEKEEPVEPKANPKNDQVTAWGKPENGLQAGFRCAREKQTLRHGQEAEVEVVVRNVSDTPIRFTFLPPSQFWGEAEKSSTVVVTVMYTGKGFPDSVTIHPGRNYAWAVSRSATSARKPPAPHMRSGPNWPPASTKWVRTTSSSRSPKSIHNGNFPRAIWTLK